MKRKSVNNFALFSREQVAEAEDGLQITAVLKNFTRPNENGELADPSAYDEFVSAYYDRGGYQLPLCYMHDSKNIIGVVTELSRDDKEMRMKATVLRSYPRFDYIADLIHRGILGGVSDGSWVEGNVNEAGVFHVTKGAVFEVSLVTVPAEVTAGVTTTNTVTSGFTHSDGLAELFDRRIFTENH